MKKNCLLIGLALLALVGCNPENETPDVKATSISVKPTTLLLSAGRQERISVFCQPEGAKLPAITWATSNPDVATIEAGVVTAIGSGEAVITASTADGLTASCAVTVDSPFKTFKLSGYGIGFGSKPFDDAEVTPIELSIGTVNCKLGYIGAYLWDDGLAYVDGVGLTGEGEAILAYVVDYIIVDEGDYEGYAVSTVNAYQFSDELVAGSIIPGGLTSEEDYIKGVITLLNSFETGEPDYSAYDAAFKPYSAQVMRYKQGAYYPIHAYATEGIIGGKEIEANGILYNGVKLTWFVGTNFDVAEGEDFTTAIYGVEIDEEGAITTDSRLVTATETYSNAELASSQVSRKAPKDYTLIAPDKPEIHVINEVANTEVLKRYMKH